MPRFFPLFLASLLVLVLGAVPGDAWAQDPDPADEEASSMDDEAMAWVGLLQREQFDSAAAEVAPAVAGQLNAESLGAAWRQITGQFGALESLEPAERVSQGGYEVVDLAGSFEAGPYTVRVVYDGEGNVSGFFVLPPGGGG